MQHRTIESPVGPLLLAGDEGGLRFVLFSTGGRPASPQPDWEPDRGLLEDPVRQLTAYFKGTLRAFDVPVAPVGTPFQTAVWRQLQAIPYGETISYGELARRLGNPRAVRAVGLANGSNPISIIIPCHRVIGSNGSLVGYGGGLPTKQALLALERGQGTLL
ncbi:MAG TPA: methylated-DNA--[protein]-cysteine S-methyltransferase [Vicinamibacterales bacterium]|nr:methylated-DNA--[protein]-cysteine S-methyltransferase [Vicinamibacterales bacterium]